MTTGDLTTLANVKAYFSPPLVTTADDALLSRLITAASGFIQSWLNRTIASATYSETRNGAGGTRLPLACNIAVRGRASARRPVSALP